MATLADIPETLFPEIRDALRFYSVALVGVGRVKDRELLTYCGSATLLQGDQRLFLITAAHVWRATGRFQELGITLGPHGSRFRIPRIVVRETLLDSGDDSEWGPDLALLQLPTEYRSRFTAYLNLYNTSRVCRRLTPEDKLLRTGAWAIVGAPSETSSITPTRIDFDGKIFLGVPGDYHVREEFDYLDIHIGLAPMPRPSTLGGVSGGGLWRLGMRQDLSTGDISWDGMPILAGVAFYELIRGENRVRCHGPYSVRRLLAAAGVP